jgi:hypothetical protein
MAYVKAETTALAQASAHIENARQQFVSHQTRLRTISATHVNQATTWYTPGASVISNSMELIDGHITRLLNSLNLIGDSVKSTGDNLTNTSATEVAAAQKHNSLAASFSSTLHA